MGKRVEESDMSHIMICDRCGKRILKVKDEKRDYRVYFSNGESVNFCDFCDECYIGLRTFMYNVPLIEKKLYDDLQQDYEMLLLENEDLKKERKNNEQPLSEALNNFRDSIIRANDIFSRHLRERFGQSDGNSSKRTSESDKEVDN